MGDVSRHGKLGEFAIAITNDGRVELRLVSSAVVRGLGWFVWMFTAHEPKCEHERLTSVNISGRVEEGLEESRHVVCAGDILQG